MTFLSVEQEVSSILMIAVWWNNYLFSCEHVSHCQSDFQTIIFQFAPYQRALLLKNAWLTSYMNPNKGQKNVGTGGKMRILKNFESQEMDRFGCHLFLTAWEVIGHLRGYEVLQQTIFILVFSQLKHMEERLRIWNTLTLEPSSYWDMYPISRASRRRGSKQTGSGHMA